MAGELRAVSGPHVIVDSIEHPELGEDDRHHLTRSLRMRPGDAMTVTDGAGRWRRCRFGDVIEPVDEVIVAHDGALRGAIGFALVKGAKPELVVQKLTELGVAEIQPFRADRSVVVWDAERRTKGERRLNRVAREAAMQSRGVWLPKVGAPLDLDTLVAQRGSDGVVRSDVDRNTTTRLTEGETRMVLIGPEGGWSDRERVGLPGAVSLGSRVLRAETAAIAAGVIVGGCFAS